MSRPAENSSPRPLGPESHTWKDFGSYLYQLMLPQAFVLQTAHPVIDAAVTKDKKYLVDPWGRAKASVSLLWPVVYARPEKAVEMGKRLRELHREIKGTDKNGQKYHALDPEAYSWVHITGFDSTVRMYEYFGTPLTPQQRQEVFEEWKQLGAMLGIIDKHIPQTEEEYWRHFNTLIEERLIWGEAVTDLMDPGYYASYPKPPKRQNMPDFVWKAIIKPFSWLANKITIATLPQSFREKFNIRYSTTDKLVFKLFALAVRTFYPMIPEEKRYIPLARRAWMDARQHPDAYRLDISTATSAKAEQPDTALAS